MALALMLGITHWAELPIASFNWSERVFRVGGRD